MDLEWRTSTYQTVPPQEEIVVWSLLAAVAQTLISSRYSTLARQLRELKEKSYQISLLGHPMGSVVSSI